MAGATIGAQTIPMVTVAMTLAASTEQHMSRMIARESTRPAAPPAAWTMRPAIRVQMVGAKTHIRDPARKIPNPARRTGRLPYRSDSGPKASVAMAIAISDRLSVSCASAVDTWKAFWIHGSEGTNICMDIGPRADTAARRMMKDRFTRYSPIVKPGKQGD